MVKKHRLILAALALAFSAACVGDNPVEAPFDPGPLPALPAGTQIVTTASGLQYAELQAGGGAVAQAGQQVRVHYTGWLSTGAPFDSSLDGAPLLFTIGGGRLIAGFDEGVRGMRVGGKRRLIIPPALGYGSEPVRDQAGRVVIPANSTLVFDIELVSIATTTAS